MSYKYDLNKLRPGDILLESFDTPQNKAIERAIGVPYSHVALYVGNGSIIESCLDVVQANNIQRELFDSPEKVKVLRIKPEFLSSNVIMAAIMHARVVVGMAYSKTDAKITYTKQYEEGNDNRQFCSRMVAQGYAKGGVCLVENPDYCTPADILHSDKLVEVKDVMIEATKEDEAFYNSPNVLEDQNDSLKYILSESSKATGADIQDLEQLTFFVLTNPDCDKRVTEIVEESGYLELWQKEKDMHPYNYEVGAFMKKYGDKSQQAAREILEVNEIIFRHYTMNFNSLVSLPAGFQELGYIRQQEKLYAQLLMVCRLRMHIALEVLDMSHSEAGAI